MQKSNIAGDDLALQREELLALLLESGETDTPAQGQRAESGCVVPLQPHGNQEPLLLIGAFHFRTLVGELGFDRPVYGLLGGDLDSEGRYLNRVEEMAEGYLEEIKRLQPEGPYYLGGYCFGGLIAYELACRLHNQGDHVALLALIDTVNPATSELDTVEARTRLRDHWTRLREKGGEYLVEWGRQRTRFERVRATMKAKQVTARLYSGWGKTHPDWLAGTASYEAEVEASSAYVPQPYSGSATVFVSTPESTGSAAETVREKWDGGWGALVRGHLEVVELDSKWHMDILEEPRVRYLAAEFRRRLDSSQGA